MPLIDGTYEILERWATGDGRTLVRATDPAGTPVRIVVYDLPPDADAAFETYRRTIKRLGRDDDVRLLDVVARPGARYAVWADPTGLPRAEMDDAWRARLEAVGLDPTAADLRRDGDAVVLAGLDGDLDDVAATAPDGVPAVDRRPRAVRTAAATALVFGVAVLLALVGWRGTVNDAVVRLPDVAGAPAADAAADLAALGLAVAPVAVPGDAPAGTVLRSDPPAGTVLRPGRTVRLTYVEANAGPAARPLPSLAGRPRADAEDALRAAGFVVGDVARIPAGLPVDTVLAHTPGPEAARPPGSAVHLLVSDGPTPDRTFLPDLRGLDVGTARDLARVAGWSADRIVVERVAAHGAAPGTVIATTPAPWHPVRVGGSTVRLLVGDPGGAPFFDGTVPEPPDDGDVDARDDAANDDANDDANDAAVEAPPTLGPTVPDVVGLPLADARRRLTRADLDARVDAVETADLPVGVLLQDPPPGSARAAAGDAVRLVVNGAPRALPRPTPEVPAAPPEVRWMPYRFEVPEGLPASRAVVLATTRDGVRSEVVRTDVEGGDVLRGTWPTIQPGPVTFDLRIDGTPYGRATVMDGVDRP